MISIAISKEWFEEVILGYGLEYENAYEYTDELGRPMVEVDVEEETFDKGSKEEGWMY